MYFDIPNHIINAIAWTVIHSIWQISIIALVMSVLLQNISPKKANKRYIIGLTSLGAVALTSGITFLLYLSTTGPVEPHLSEVIFLNDITIYNSTGLLGWIDSMYAYLNHNSYIITQIWIIGAIIWGIRFILGFLYVQYLNYTPGLTANRSLENTLHKVMNKMNVAGSILIAETSKVTTPIVTGYLKPIILFPLGMPNQLTPEEVEIIITHELAHILRYDWIVNLIQSMVEIIFYYHPGVWWISSHIREERENSCDDLALNYGYSHLSYAKVLIKLKEMQLHRNPGLALSFFNTKNTLMNRIKRLLGQPMNSNNFKEKAIALALVCTVAVAFAGTRITKESLDIPFLNNDKSFFIDEEIIDVASPVLMGFPQDTIPEKKEKKSTFLLKNSEGKTYNIESENGEITRLEVDGTIIPPEQYDQYIDEIDGGEDWKFNFDGDERFRFFQMDSFPSFSFDFDHEMMGQEWQEGFERLSERLGDIDWGHLEELELRNWEGEEEFKEQMEELKMKLNELNLKNLEQFEGLERLRDMEGLRHLEELEHMRGFKDLEHLKELEGMKEMFKNYDFNFNFPEWEMERPHFGGNTNDLLARELNEDGLIKIGENNEIELTGKHLKINGEKQPSNIWEKYKNIFEESTGMKLSKDSKVKFDIIGKESRIGIRRI